MSDPIQLRADLGSAPLSDALLVADPSPLSTLTVRHQRWTDHAGRSAARLSGYMVVLAAVLWPALVHAQSSSASYELPRQTNDGGSTRASSTSFAVEGTIGQPDAASSMTSPSHELRGGFHRDAATDALPDQVFSNGFE